MNTKQNALLSAPKTAERDRIVLDHLFLVKAIAHRMHRNLPVNFDFDDLVHAGILGLFDAATKYDPDKHVVFASYAKHRIRGAILDSLRQLDWVPRDLRRQQKRVEAVIAELSSTLQHTPTDVEIAAKLGVGIEQWHKIKKDFHDIGRISASSRPKDQDDLPAPDFPCKPETHPDKMCAREQMQFVVGTAMKTLPPRYQQVVRLYYTNELTMKQIGGRLGINESRVSQIHRAALDRMHVVMQSNGIQSSHSF